jgi:hypothetical protein
MPRVARGHVEQLPSGSFRAVVYAGVDPLTRRQIYLKATARTEKQAQVELGQEHHPQHSRNLFGASRTPWKR